MENTKKCPCCENDLNGFKDYPLIFVKNFEVIPIPDVVLSHINFKSHHIKQPLGLMKLFERPSPDFPSEIIEKLRAMPDETPRIDSDDFIYIMNRMGHEFEFNRYTNRAGYIKNLMETTPEISHLFTLLQSSVGKEIERKYMLKDLRPSQFGYSLTTPGHNASIEFRNSDSSTIQFNLYADIERHWYSASSKTSLPIARMQYEGRLKTQ